MEWGCLAGGVVCGLGVVIAFRRRRVAWVVGVGLLALSALPLIRNGCSPPTGGTTGVPASFEAVADPSVRELFSRLEAELKDPSADCRLAAVHAIGRVASSVGKPAVLALCSGLDDPDSGVRCGAALVLYYSGPSARAAVPKLTAELKSPDPTRVEDALRAFSTVADPSTAVDAIPLLAELVKGRPGMPPSVRVLAARALGLLAPKEVAVPALTTALGDPDILTQWEAIAGLKRFGSAAKPALPKLVDILAREHGSGIAVSTLASTLAAIGVEAVPPLVDLLKRRTGGAPGAAEALGLLGEEGKTAVPALVEALRLSGGIWDHQIRQHALVALGRIGPPAADAAPRVRDELWANPKKPDNVAAAALRGIGGPQAGKAAAELIAVMNTAPDPDGRAMTRGGAIDCLGELQAEAAIPHLVNGLRAAERDGEWRLYEQSLIRVIGRFGGIAHEAVPVLTQFLRDPPGKGARLELAIQALGDIGPRSESAVGEVCRLLKDRTHFAVHATCLRTLGNMGSAGKGAVPTLRSLRDNVDSGYMWNGIDLALNKITGEPISPNIGR